MKRAVPVAVVLFGLLLLAPPAQGRTGEMTTGDRAEALYSTQFAFDASGVPVVSVALMDEQAEILLSAPDGLRVLTEGPGGAAVEVDEAGTWRAHVEDARPAQVLYWVVVQRIPARDLAAVRAARQWFAEQKIPVRSFEVGSIFAFFGQMMDNRAVLFALDESHGHPAAATAAAEAASQRLDRETWIHAVLDKRATGTVVMTSPSGKVRLRGQSVLWMEPRDADSTLLVRGVEFGKGFAWAGREDRSYRGRLYLAVGKSGKLAVVNHVDAETMLRGVVPAEIYHTAHHEALRAQAVVARGEVLAKIGTRHLADPYLLCADVHCQVYAGAGKEQPSTDRAVRETRGEMLFSAAGLVDSVYHSNCGGLTEHNEHVWPAPPSPDLRGVFDGPRRPDWLPEGELSEADVRRFLSEPVESWSQRASKGAHHFRWTSSLKAAELDRLVAARFPDLGPVQALQVLSRGVSGRARDLRVEGRRGHVVVERELPIRRLLGGLKSGLFVVDVERDASGAPRSFTFRGGGFGHGVGMSQVGAIGMAEAGRRYAEILAHYYGGAGPRKVY